MAIGAALLQVLVALLVACIPVAAAALYAAVRAYSPIADAMDQVRRELMKLRPPLLLVPDTADLVRAVHQVTEALGRLRLRVFASRPDALVVGAIEDALTQLHKLIGVLDERNDENASETRTRALHAARSALTVAIARQQARTSGALKMRNLMLTARAQATLWWKWVIWPWFALIFAGAVVYGFAPHPIGLITFLVLWAVALLGFGRRVISI